MPKATATNFSAPSSFEKQKWADEKRLKERELDIKQKEVDKSVWSNPLFLALCAAVITAIVSILVAWFNNKNQLALESKKADEARIAASENSKRQYELELVKAEQGRILEAIRTGNPDKAAENLNFMLDVGLITTPGIAEKLRLVLSKRKPRTGPSLPSRSAGGWDDRNWSYYDNTDYVYNKNSYRNPSTTYVETTCSKVDGKCSTKESRPPENRGMSPKR